MFCNYCGAPNPDVASFCNKCGKALAAAPASAPVSTPAQSRPINYVVEMAPPVSPVRQETRASIGGTLTPAARTEFTNGLTVEVRRQMDDKCIPVGIVAWIITMIAVAGWFSIPEFGQTWGMVIGLVMAFVLAGVVTKIMNVYLEDKWVGPIANLSDEMLVNRYNEAKADRRASRTRTAISWAVIAIIVFVLVITWVAAQRH